MMLHSYPLLISIYKGEGRMLIVPLIDHIAGYSIDSDWFINLSDLDNAVSVGEGVKSALDYIRNSPLSSLTPNERKENAAWKKNTKYRSRVAFWKNNHYVRVKITEDSTICKIRTYNCNWLDAGSRICSSCKHDNK